MKSLILCLNTTTHSTYRDLPLDATENFRTQTFEIETTDDSGIRPKTAHELATHQVGGPLNLSYTCRDRKNYLQNRRQRELAFGQAGSMLKYFHDKITENPSFQYDYQHILGWR